jgi:folate-dependent phosphoribosylglycinamide formyltransferase PurN
MSSITFDTLAYSKKLRSAGFTEQQAEVAAKAQKETIEIVMSEIETRHLNEMATKLDLAEVKADLIRWVVAAGFLQTVLIAALLLKLIK